MKISKIKIFGFGNYLKEVEIDFEQIPPDRKYFLINGQNGVGKSMFFELITNCLIDDGRAPLKDLIPKVLHNSDKRSFVELTMSDTHGQHYVIEKSLSYTSAVYIEFYKIDRDGNKIMISEGNREAKAAISEFIKIDNESFYNSLYASQGELLSFIFKTPEESRKIIMNILGIEELSQKSKKGYSVARSLNAKSKEYQNDKASYNSSDETEEDLTKRKNLLEKDKEKLQATLTKNETIQEGRQNLLSNIETFDNEYSEVYSKKKEIEEDWSANLEVIKKMMLEDGINLDDIESPKEKVKSVTDFLSSKSKELREKIDAGLSSKGKVDLFKERLELYKNGKSKEHFEIKSIKESLLDKTEQPVEIKETLDELKEKKTNLSRTLEDVKEEIRTMGIESEDLESYNTLEGNEDKITKEVEKYKEAKYVDEAISPLKEKIAILKSDRAKIVQEVKTLEENLKSGEIIYCECCGSQVKEDAKDHYHKKLKELGVEAKKTETAKIEKEIEKLKTSIVKKDEELEDIDSQIEFLEDVKTYILSVELDKKIEAAKKEKEKFEKELKEVVDKISVKEEENLIKESKEKIKKLESDIEEQIENLEKSIKEESKNLSDLEESTKQKEVFDSLLKKFTNLYQEFTELNSAKRSIKTIIDSAKLLGFEGTKLDGVKEFISSLDTIDLESIKTKIRSINVDLENVDSQLRDKKDIEKINKKISIVEREKMFYEGIGDVFDKMSKEMYKKAIPLIESVVNKKLDISSQGKYRFFIQTELEGKEVFLPKIYRSDEGQNSSRSIKTMSGGESAWVATALRDAMVLLISRRSHPWRFAIYDEAFDSQDGEHGDILVDAIFSSNFADQVFFVTHNLTAQEKILDKGATLIELTRDEDGHTQVELNI